MKMKKGSWLFLAILIICLITGCSGQNQTTASPSATPSEANGQNSASPDSDNQGAQEGAQETVYPIPDGVTLTWVEESENYNNVTQENNFYQQLEKNTGVTLDRIGGAKMNTDEFNLILASKALPDIWKNDWLNYPGGPQEAINQGYILKLNDVIDQFAPNFKKVLDENPEIAKQIRTDDGSYYVFPFIRSDYDRTYTGPIIRTDWLKDLGLEIPTTIDEWHTVLKAFKEQKNASAPLTFQLSRLNKTGGFAGAFGVSKGFYLEGDNVVFGEIQPDYKLYLQTMHQWYEEGLLDQDFASIDGKTVDTKMSNGDSGATIQLGSRVTKYGASAAESGIVGTYAGIPYPTLVKGDTPEFGQTDNYYPGGASGAISPTSKHIEEAVRWYDYLYSEEGSKLLTYGTEGISYTVDNGKIVFTDLIKNNPEKLDMDQARQIYAMNTNFPQIQKDTEASRSQEQIDAVEAWKQTNQQLHSLPPITPTSEEAKKVSSIYADIQSYIAESEVRFILGTTSLDKFDDFVSQVKKLGIDEVIALKQAAYVRYQNR